MLELHVKRFAFERRSVMADIYDMDSFWDIAKLVPSKKKSTLSSFSSKEKTVDVSVCGDKEENSERRKITVTEKIAENAKPEAIYYPSSALIKKVKVTHIPDKFDFHANFKKAAELFFDSEGDECPFAPFYSYMPQYTQLTQAQKNYYFYWRSTVRRGKYVKTDYSYLYLFAYEVINLPERISPEEGLRLLVGIWKNYRKELPNIDSNMALWVQDYCLVYNLKAPMEEISEFIFDVMNVARFKEFYFSSYETFDSHGIEALIAYLSDYDWRKSRYAGGDNREAYTKHLVGAMCEFIKRFLFGNPYAIESDSVFVRSDNAFRMALVTSEVKYHLTVEYRRIAEDTGIRSRITAALKYTENKLRALLGVKSRLAVKDINSDDCAIIDSYFDDLFKKVKHERMMASRPEYEKLYEAEAEELSTVGADEIERASWQTTARLIVEEEEEETVTDAVCISKAPEAETVTRDDETYGLSDEEIDFVSYAYEENYDEMRRIASLMGCYVDAVADKINETFSDNFGDVILMDVGDGYAVISDYREDVENWLTKITK